MTELRPIDETRELIEGLSTDAAAYFAKAADAMTDIEPPHPWSPPHRDYYWRKMPTELRADAQRLTTRLLSVMGQIARDLRGAPLASEADQRDVMTATKAMRAALFLREFRSSDPQVLHDEDIVLGVEPASQSDHVPESPKLAVYTFSGWLEKVLAVVDLIAAAPGMSAPEGKERIEAARYRPGTAFIMMWMDPNQPELADIADAVKEVFAQFDVQAVRADDIEHEELITQRIITEIKTAEFCFADLSGARPNVYYEVGYAHALARRVILFRKAGTGLHFDLAGYNCPEYANLRELKTLLTQRLKHLTNKEPKH